MNIKEPVKLRKRKLKNGNLSLYLDIYFNGVRKYEFLKLYLSPNKSDREKNKQTLQLANSIKAKRIVEIQRGSFGYSTYLINTNFLDYFSKMTKDRINSSGNHGNWRSCLIQLKEYCPAQTQFKDINKEWIIGFKEHLDSKDYAQNTKVSYFNKLRACLNKAFEERIIPDNPLRGVSGFKQEETKRTYLTLEELKLMAETECKYDILRRTFLFSCLTGIRKSDIERIRWKDIHLYGDFTRIIFRQKKTQGQEYLDINSQASSYMGERGLPEEKVFPEFRYSSYLITELRMWAMKAGIAKDITFHTARHTFAVLMLELDTDIYTVQKLLGHKDIRTTQIYAKVLDKKKQEAVSKIPNLLNND